VRETVEEAGANIELHQLFSLINVRMYTRYICSICATLLDLDYEAGVESLEVKLFAADEIPWDEIAFPTISHTLRFLFWKITRS
jgi:hypothetical protein